MTTIASRLVEARGGIIFVTMDLMSISAMAISRVRSSFGEKERWICVRPRIKGTSRRADAVDKAATAASSADSNGEIIRRDTD